MKLKRKEFTEKVNSALGDGFKYEDFMNNPELEDLGTPIYPNYTDDDDRESPQAIEADDEHETDADTYDQYVGACVVLPMGDKQMIAKVIGRKRMLDGSVSGKANTNPILDTTGNFELVQYLYIFASNIYKINSSYNRIK